MQSLDIDIVFHNVNAQEVQYMQRSLDYVFLLIFMYVYLSMLFIFKHFMSFICTDQLP